MPPRVVVLRVLSPCGSFSFTRPQLSCFSAAVCRFLAVVASCCFPHPTPTSTPPPNFGFAPRRLRFSARLPLLPAGRSLALVPGRFCSPPPCGGCDSRVLESCHCFPVSYLLLVRRRMWPLAVAPPRFVFRGCSCPAPCSPLFSLCLLGAACLFAVCFRLVLRPPPLISVSRVWLPCFLLPPLPLACVLRLVLLGLAAQSRGAWCVAVLLAALCGPSSCVPCRVV